MPLTRRVQVYISEEASNALDRLVAKGLTQTQAVERSLIDAIRLDVFEQARDAHYKQIENGETPTSVTVHGITVTPVAGAALDAKRDADEVLREAQRKLEARRGESDSAKKVAEVLANPPADAQREYALGYEGQLDAVGPTVDSGRGKATTETFLRPLERERVKPIPKPGKR